MDFFVCDNIETYNKRFEFNGIDSTRLLIEDIFIPDSGSFWFKTGYDVVERNINLNKKYLHIHSGLTQFEDMQFDTPPHKVMSNQMFYDPKTKSIEVLIPKHIFFTQTIFKKKCLYLGTKEPIRKLAVLGEAMYNMSNQTIYFILNYFPQGTMKFHWEEEVEPTMEQRIKTEMLNENEKTVVVDKSPLSPSRSHFKPIGARA